MYRDLTRGSILRSLLLFALPMLAGDILQQLYNIADTLIVSRAIGRDALAAVGSAYTLMIFLTSILLGLSMGAGALFSICRGRGDESGLRQSIVHAFGLIGVCTLLLTALAYALLPALLRLLQVPESVSPLMRTYLAVIFAGIPATFLYNFFACLLRSVGNSMTPLVFSGISALGNVDHSLVEAAQVDGANRRQVFWKIKWAQIMPTTPNGTRTLRRVMPLGRVHSAIVSPCGEGSPATDSMSAAIEAMRSAVSRRRSRMGESASIASRSRALAASTFPAFSRSRAAAFTTVRLNRPASTRASSLPARRAATKIVSYSIFIPDIGNRSESAV